MEFFEILSDRRKAAAISFDELSAKSGVPVSTIKKILTGVTRAPQFETLRAITHALGLTLDDLDGDKRQFTYEEKELINAYRCLDASGQLMVRTVADIERDRCKSYNHNNFRLISMPVYNDPAAAGEPLYAESDYERIDFPVDEVPSKAEFGIRISGDSMEPTITNEQIVWIKRCSDIADHHIGVFMLSDGTAVCKRADAGPDGRIIRLLSDNHAYDPIEGNRLDGLRIVGEVLNT